MENDKLQTWERMGGDEKAATKHGNSDGQIEQEFLHDLDWKQFPVKVFELNPKSLAGHLTRTCKFLG